MDWTQTYVILGFVGIGFLHILSGIKKMKGDISQGIQRNQEEIMSIKFRLDPFEYVKWKNNVDPKDN